MKKLWIIFCLFEVLSLKSPELNAGKLAHVRSHTVYSYKSSEKFHWILGFPFSPTIKHTMYFIFFWFSRTEFLNLEEKYSKRTNQIKKGKSWDMITGNGSVQEKKEGRAMSRLEPFVCFVFIPFLLNFPSYPEKHQQNRNLTCKSASWYVMTGQ